jgi:hypothetical protein
MERLNKINNQVTAKAPQISKKMQEEINRLKLQPKKI